MGTLEVTKEKKPGNEKNQETLFKNYQKCKKISSHNMKYHGIVSITVINGNNIVISHPEYLQILSLPNFKSLAKVKHCQGAEINYLTKLNEDMLLLCDKKNFIQVWKISNKYPKLIKKFQGDDWWITKLLPLQNAQFASCSVEQAVKIWDIHSNFKSIKSIFFPEVINTIYQLRNGNLLVFLGNGKLKIYCNADYLELNELGNIYCIGDDTVKEFLDNKIILYGHGLIIVNLNTMQIEATIYTTGHIFCMALFDNNNVLCGSDKGDIKTFKLKDYTFLSIKNCAHDLMITRMIKITNQTLVSISTDGIITYWKIEHIDE